LDARSERPDARHELKLVGDEAALAEVRMALRLDRAGIRTLFPPRVVQSVYLDTPFQRSLEENVAGLSSREKVRLRWYGEASERVEGVLERKCRENSLGWKECVPLGGPMDVAGQPRRPFVRALERRVDARWRQHLAGHEPAQWVSYLREYFETADRRVRLTLDRELAFADQRPLPRLDPSRRTGAPRLLVLELKCAPGDLDRARDLIGRLPLMLGRCSKFVLAAVPGSGPLPSQFEV
jgi:hypothetical protein